MNRTEFAQGLALMTGAVGKPMPDEQIAAWFALLSDLTAVQLRRGIVETLRTHQFAGFPPVGTVRMNSLVGAASVVAQKDRPMAAWLTVRDRIRGTGAYDSPNFADPVINAVIRELGGWPLICDTPTNEMQWLEKRFCAAYSALSGAVLPEHLTKRLAGITEIDNCRHGYRAEPIRVAEVACLTDQSDQSEPVRMRLETVGPDSPTAHQRAHEAVKQLTKALPLVDADADTEPGKANRKAKSVSVRSRDEQVAALERLARATDSRRTTEA